jgi:hypothetical protein
MKQILSIIFLALLFINANAQDIDVDKKTGLVQVDGKDAFYLKPKNKVLFSSDFSLQNMLGQELAYLKSTQGSRFNSATGTYQASQIFVVTFTQSANQCNITDFTSLSIIKSLAKTIVAANLVENNAISAASERKFVTMNNGTFFINPNAEQKKEPNIVVNVNTDQQSNHQKAAAVSILLKNDKVYNNDELIANFKTNKTDAKTVLSIYNAKGELVCTASHPNNDNDDWDLDINGTQKKLLYNPTNPLEKLFTYLIDKGIL